jgi:hypothetical protein
MSNVLVCSQNKITTILGHFVRRIVMCKKLICLFSVVLVLGLAGSNAAFGDVLEIRIDSATDDMEEYVADGTHDLGSSDLEITEEGGPENNQLIGLRFNNVAVPQGAVITDAYVQFQVDEVDVPGDNRPGTKFLRGEAVDNAVTFSDALFDIASRPTTSAEASWDWPEWLTVDEEGPDQRTSDISAVIQEIVDRPGWVSGNSLALIITGSGENTAESFDGEPEAAALLHIEFTSDGAPNPVVLFEEDFEGLTLGPNIDETLAGDAVWTDTPPDGWMVDESGIPGIGVDETDGVTEWAGWAFADKAWWIQAAEDQNRSQFALANGTVAVADPDEWDDADRLGIPIDADPYDTWLSTPEIDISEVEAGTLELKFDSSWRPEFDDNYHQTANITASFDGGEPVEVLLWESDASSPNFKPDSTNETVIVNLDNPEGADSVVLTFGLYDAGNDWWWAIDNIEVTGVPKEKIVVLSEDFEGLTLGPNVDEALAGEQVWTDTPPAGWTVDESGIPGIGMDETDGVTEWAGWAFADKAWWTETAGDQRRSEFTLGRGTVAVADPDEWDDADRLSEPIADNPYDTLLTTPEIDITGVMPGTLKLKFDSSWRPEFDDNYHQTADITVSYDGGEHIEVLLWESDSSSPNFKDDNSTNETITVDLQNPEGAKSVVLTFSLYDAGNDWWWAIDNIEVSGEPLAGTIAELRIADDADDVEEFVDTGEMYTDSSDLELAYEHEAQADPQIIGLRYTGVSIPKGATITKAWIRFQVDETKGGEEPVNVIIEGELSPDAGEFALDAFNVSGRTRTAAQVKWSVPGWTNVGDQGPDQTTPDIAPVIQEIVNQDDWAGGSIVLIISDDPDNPSLGIRCAEAGPGDDAALLHIEYK